MENRIQNESQDTTAFIDSIREESDRRIAEITKKAEEEIAAIEKSYRNDIDAFEKENSKQIEEEISLEVDKLRNRAEIEKKKLNLAMIEEVIQKLIKEALEEIKAASEDRYNDFMNKGLLRILSEVDGNNILLRISPKDSSLQPMLRKIIKESKYNGTIEIVEDEIIKNGGFIIDDSENNMSFNNTFERLVYRKYDIIRKRAFRLIMEEGKK